MLIKSTPCKSINELNDNWQRTSLLSVNRILAVGAFFGGNPKPELGQFDVWSYPGWTDFVSYHLKENAVTV